MLRRERRRLSVDRTGHRDDSAHAASLERVHQAERHALLPAERQALRNTTRGLNFASESAICVASQERSLSFFSLQTSSAGLP